MGFSHPRGGTAHGADGVASQVRQLVGRVARDQNRGEILGIFRQGLPAEHPHDGGFHLVAEKNDHRVARGAVISFLGILALELDVRVDCFTDDVVGQAVAVLVGVIVQILLVVIPFRVGGGREFLDFDSCPCGLGLDSQVLIAPVGDIGRVGVAESDDSELVDYKLADVGGEKKNRNLSSLAS